ncbi:hypothetical protein [Mesorhizobium sp. 128a]
MRDLETIERQRGINGVISRLARWAIVRFNTSRTIDGVVIIGDKGVDKIVEALGLIKNFDPIRYTHLRRDVGQILVTTLPASVAQWGESLKACELDERYLTREGTTPAHIASTIVHEATHARLMRCGIGYEETLRDRVERVACAERSLSQLGCRQEKIGLKTLRRHLPPCPISPTGQ